jgi:hypothetical protein
VLASFDKNNATCSRASGGRLAPSKGEWGQVELCIAVGQSDEELQASMDGLWKGLQSAKKDDDFSKFRWVLVAKPE